MLSQLMCREGYKVGRWLAHRLMQECGLESGQPGRQRYRGVKEEAMASPDLLRRRFTPETPDKAWSGDISYVRVKSGWCYLALVIDLYSRRIVGSAVSSSPDAERVCRAMRRALESRSCRTGRLLCHSDQGSQYRSKKYRQLLWRHGVMQSMSRKGNCLDNSPMERVFRSLKSEWIPVGGYSDIRQIMQDITVWIHYYNQYRPHTFNGGLSPCEYENQWKEAMQMC